MNQVVIAQPAGQMENELGRRISAANQVKPQDDGMCTSPFAIAMLLERQNQPPLERSALVLFTRDVDVLSFDVKDEARASSKILTGLSLNALCGSPRTRHSPILSGLVCQCRSSLR
jgi:hypothetical protein